LKAKRNAKIITGLAILGLIGYIIYVNRQYISFLNTEEKNKKKNDVIIKHKDTKTDKKKNDVITKHKNNKIFKDKKLHITDENKMLKNIN
jgi:hypothetical protein